MATRAAVRPVEVHVTAGNGEVFSLRGRVARMVLWLCRNEAAIVGKRRGDLRVNFDGNYQAFVLAEAFEGGEGY